jgi:hypothetical protein
MPGAGSENSTIENIVIGVLALVALLLLAYLAARKINSKRGKK